MARNTSILLGEHFEKFISGKISSGKYNSASEVIRIALRLFEAEESRMKDLNKALSQGEKSGFEKNLDPKKHLKKLHSKFLEATQGVGLFVPNPHANTKLRPSLRTFHFNLTQTSRSLPNDFN